MVKKNIQTCTQRQIMTVYCNQKVAIRQTLFKLLRKSSGFTYTSCAPTSVKSNTYLTISNYSPIYSVDGICFHKKYSIAIKQSRHHEKSTVIRNSFHCLEEYIQKETEKLKPETMGTARKSQTSDCCASSQNTLSKLNITSSSLSS